MFRGKNLAFEHTVVKVPEEPKLRNERMSGLVAAPRLQHLSSLVLDPVAGAFRMPAGMLFQPPNCPVGACYTLAGIRFPDDMHGTSVSHLARAAPTYNVLRHESDHLQDHRGGGRERR